MGIFRFYNQNRIMFWTIIIAIIIFVFIIHIMNSIIITNNEKPKNTVINERLYENKIDIEKQISDEQVEQQKELIIDQFIRYCNAKNIQDAYNLLTEECKENVFPSLEVFEEQYVKQNFNTQKLYSKKQYLGSTYEVVLYENILVTGNTSSKTNQDYYTIINKDGKTKLNISNYIKRQELNKKVTYDKIQIEVTKKDIYMEYEVYELKVTNLAQNIIILDTKENTKSMYLVDKNNVKYYSTSHEVLDNSLLIKPMAVNTIKIKYTKDYKSNSSRKLVFENIILDYIQNTKISEYNRVKMEVNV